LNKKNVIILATKGQTTNLLYNQLVQHFNVKKVILENKISKKIILKNRIKKLGLFKVIGQVLFMGTIPKVLNIISKKRIKQIILEANQDDKPIPTQSLINVNSINDDSISQLINQMSPDLIFVNGTRIISKKIIKTSNAKMINIHVGITPNYRGVHGGYWALYNDDLVNFGTTVHFIDSGIDTGSIIAQATTKISNKDNFVTYPVIQYCLGLKILSNKITKSNFDNIELLNSKVSKSKLHYHPTFLQYIYKRIVKKIK